MNPNPLTSFVGNLTRDPVVKSTPKGDIAEFGIAVSDGFGDGATTEFLNVAVWNEGLRDQIMVGGDNGRPLLYKGAPVAVQGTVKPRQDYNDDVSAVRVGLVTWLQRSQLNGRDAAPQPAPVAADDLDF